MSQWENYLLLVFFGKYVLLNNSREEGCVERGGMCGKRRDLFGEEGCVEREMMRGEC